MSTLVDDAYGLSQIKKPVAEVHYWGSFSSLNRDPWEIIFSGSQDPEAGIGRCFAVENNQ
jgi:hypothetical protein